MNRKRIALFLTFLFYFSCLSWAGEVRKLWEADLYIQATDGGPPETVTLPSGATGTRISGGAFPWDNGYTRTIRPGDIITKGPWVDPRAHHDGNGVYFGEGNTGAQNKAALQAAFDNAAALGSGGLPVHIPGGAFYITGTVDTKGVPFSGAGGNKTKFFPTTDVPVFDITLSHGIVGNFSIDYIGVASPTCPAIRLKSVTQARLEAIVILRGYQGIQVTSGFGDGYIWQVEFDHIIQQLMTDYAFYIDSSSDSTTLKWSNCHVYGSSGVGKGWYIYNTTTAVLSNCSMDYGANIDGSVISFLNGHKLVIDTFHLEGFTHTLDTISPIYFSGGANIQNLFTVAYDVNVGTDNVAYLLKSTYPSTVEIGSYKSLSPIVTSGISRLGSFATSQSVTVLSLAGGRGAYDNTLDASQFLLANTSATEATRTRLMAEIYYQPWVKEVGSYLLLADNTAQNLINLPLVTRVNGFLYPHANLTVAGRCGTEAFMDQVTVISLASSFAQIKQTVLDNTASAPTRTYALSSDNVTLQLSTGTCQVAINGKLLYPRLYE